MNIASIVIATYNGSEHISEQLHSILDQTFRDFEIIVIDDCSHDSTVEIIKEIFAERRFLNYIIEVNSSNIGVTKSFEKGIGKSKGKYIAICDQDDIWFSDKLEVSLNTMRKNDADVVYSPSLILNGSNKTSSIYPEHTQSKNLFALLMHNNARGATLLLKKEFVESIIPFSNHDLYDKWIYFLGLLYGKMIYIDTPLHYYRVHRNNYVGTQHKFRRKEELLEAFNSSVLFYNQLMEYVNINKDIEAHFSYADVLKEIENIIVFFNDTSACINSKNIMKCLFKYLKNISGKGFGSKEKMIYFYYYFLKMR